MLEKAKNLSAYETRSLVEIHLRAMRAFVAELEQRRCGATSKRRTKSANASRAETTDPTAGLQSEPEESADLPRQRGEGADLQSKPEESADLPRQRSDSREPLERDDTAEPPPQHGDDGDGADYPRRRGRYVSPAVRRAVWQRDQGRCTYVDDRGVRCRETACLELDHELAHARGGPPTVTNIRLRCRGHNQLTAEREFGREFMDRKRWTGAAG